MNFRHEWKHQISFSNMLTLRSRLAAVMDCDTHAPNGKYEIRSLYFDNLFDKALREKIDGINCREKFRLRYYNQDPSYILLEKKSKINGLCNKLQTRISVKEAASISKNNFDFMENTTDPLLKELYAKTKNQLLVPKTIVDYTRIPFVYEPGNVRVTIDYNIRTGLLSTDFLNPDCITLPVENNPIILEVKWDEFLPSIIRDLVQIPNTHTAAFSKYAACRIYG